VRKYNGTLQRPAAIAPRPTQGLHPTHALRLRPAPMARFAPPLFVNGLDPDTTEGAIDLAYDLPNMHVEYVRIEPPGIPTAFWRSVGPSHNVFVTESFMDELVKLLPDLKMSKVVVSEAGASVHSASAYASEELPDLDVSLRGAVSIARRLCV
jgi:Tex protein YqgF-like domain